MNRFRNKECQVVLQGFNRVKNNYVSHKEGKIKHSHLSLGTISPLELFVAMFLSIAVATDVSASRSLCLWVQLIAARIVIAVHQIGLVLSESASVLEEPPSLSRCASEGSSKSDSPPHAQSRCTLVDAWLPCVSALVRSRMFRELNSVILCPVKLRSGTFRLWRRVLWLDCEGAARKPNPV